MGFIKEFIWDEFKGLVKCFLIIGSIFGVYSFYQQNKPDVDNSVESVKEMVKQQVKKELNDSFDING